MPKNRERTMNDLAWKELCDARMEHIEKNRMVLLEYMGWIEMAFLKQSFFGRIFMSIPEIKINECDRTLSNLRFSKNPISVPKILDFVSQLLVKNNLQVGGIFRVNSTKKRVETVIEIVKNIVDAKLPIRQGLDQLDRDFNIIDLAESYKALLKSLGSPIIPKKMIKMAIKVQKIENPDHKKTCVKAMIFSLPLSNRMVLENCIYVNSKISAKLRTIEAQDKMNLEGLAIVMMPSLIHPGAPDVYYADIKGLSDFVCYVFENFEDLLKV